MPKFSEIAKFMVSEGNSALLTPIVDHLLGFTFTDFYAQKFFFSRVCKKSLHDLSLGKLVNFVPLFSSLGNMEILVNQIKSFP